jgi:outer membrane immunogenic protein
MKLKFFAAALAASTIAGSAFAADLPSRKVAPAYVAPAPIMTWSGFYIGLNAGYTWSNSNVSYAGVPVTPPFFPDFGLASNALIGAKNNGFIGGGQIGWNYQFSPSFMAGLEADIQGIANSGNINVSRSFADPASAVPMTMTYGGQKKLDWFGTLRGRLGFVASPAWLLYATGGLALGGAKLNSTWTLIRPGVIGAGFSPDLAATSASGTRVGWTIGAGTEWKFTQNWSAKLEYLYYDLGRLSTTTGVLIDTGAAAGAANLAVNSSSARFNGHIVRAGVNYHFGGVAGPVVAKY